MIFVRIVTMIVVICIVIMFAYLAAFVVNAVAADADTRCPRVSVNGLTYVEIRTRGMSCDWAYGYVTGYTHRGRGRVIDIPPVYACRHAALPENGGFRFWCDRRHKSFAFTVR